MVNVAFQDDLDLLSPLLFLQGLLEDGITARFSEV